MFTKEFAEKYYYYYYESSLLQDASVKIISWYFTDDFESNTSFWYPYCGVVKNQSCEVCGLAKVTFLTAKVC